MGLGAEPDGPGNVFAERCLKCLKTDQRSISDTKLSGSGFYYQADGIYDVILFSS